MSEFRYFASFMAVALTVIAGLVVGARQVVHHYGAASCRQFAAQSGFETKYADFTFWTFDCLAKTDSGKWISADNLREVNQ